MCEHYKFVWHQHSLSSHICNLWSIFNNLPSNRIILKSSRSAFLALNEKLQLSTVPFCFQNIKFAHLHYQWLLYTTLSKVPNKLQCIQNSAAYPPTHSSSFEQCSTVLQEQQLASQFKVLLLKPLITRPPPYLPTSPLIRNKHPTRVFTRPTASFWNSFLPSCS